MKSKIMNFVWIGLALAALFYIWKKFSGSGVVTSTNDLRTTGTAGDGFLNFYPGWRTVPTPSSPSYSSQSSQLPQLITSLGGGVTSLIGSISKIWNTSKSSAPSTSSPSSVPYSVDDSDFYNPGENVYEPSYDTNFDGPDYSFDSEPADYLYA